MLTGSNVSKLNQDALLPRSCLAPLSVQIHQPLTLEKLSCGYDDLMNTGLFYWILTYVPCGFFFLINYYWSIVALQCCFCFFCRAKGISFMFTFIPSFGFPSHSGHHGALSRVPCVIQQGLISYQFYGGCSAARLCSALWDPMDCSPSGFPVLHHLPEFAQNSCPLSQ